MSNNAFQCPPNGQGVPLQFTLIRRLKESGITALIALGILEKIQNLGISQPLLQLDHNSPDYLHALIEALRQIQLCTATLCTDIQS